MFHQYQNSREQNFKFNFVSAYFFKISFSFGFIPNDLLSLTFTFNCNFSINIVVFHNLFSLKMSDEG